MSDQDSKWPFGAADRSPSRKTTPTVPVAGPPGPEGPIGPAGADGATGPAGEGVAIGGTTGQVLKKTSNLDFDTEWADESGGGDLTSGPVTSSGGVSAIANGEITNAMLATQFLPLAGGTMTGNLSLGGFDFDAGGGSVTADSFVINAGASIVGGGGSPTITLPATSGTLALTSDLADKVSDTAYDATSWNGVTDVAPSKNAVRYKFELLANQYQSNPVNEIILEDPYTLTIADISHLFTAASSCTLTLPSFTLTGYRVWLQAESGATLSLSGDIRDYGGGDDINSITSADGLCELFDMFGSWKLRRGKPSRTVMGIGTTDNVQFAGLTCTTGVFSSTVTFADGTNTTPSIAFTSDADNGFYKPSTANTVGMVCSGGERFRFSASILTTTNNVTIGWSSSTASSGTVDTGMSRDSAGVVQVNNGTPGTLRDLKLRNLLPSSVTVASLTGAVEGARSFVTDSTVAASGNFGAIVAGGGTDNVPVFYDGTNWRIG